MPLINPFDHVISEFRIPPNEMPSLSTPSQAPTYQSLRTFQKALNHNAMSIHSTQTQLGHLHLVITNAEYLKANNNVPFKVPADPEAPASTDDEADDDTEDDVGIGATTRSMFALATSSTDPTSTTLQSIKTFELQQQKYFKYNATVVALRNLILNAVDNKYITDLEDDLTGYAKVSPLELMTHLWTSYGTVDDADHAANEEAMKKPWTPPEPIATLFEQLKKGQEFAARGNEVIDDTQLIRWGYQNIKNTGLFNRECEKWRKKTQKEKSWSDFKKHFILAYDDHLKYDSIPPTTAEATYTANQVQQILQDELSTILGSNVTPDPSPSDNPPVPEPVIAAANATVTLDDVRRLIQETLSASSSPHPTTQTSSNRVQDPGQRPPRPPLVAQGLLRGKPVSYCWTHGVTSNLRHTSASCRRKATGHKDEATYSNRMGGSQSSLVPPE